MAHFLRHDLPSGEEYEEISSYQSGRVSPEVDDQCPFKRISHASSQTLIGTHRLLRKKRPTNANRLQAEPASAAVSAPGSEANLDSEADSERRIHTESVSEIQVTTISQEQIVHPLPPDLRIRCILHKKQTTFSTKFMLYLEGSGQFLLAARRAARTPSSYIISKSAEDISNKRGNCLAKLKSNFLGTQFLMSIPRKHKNRKMKHGTERCARELAAITYKKNLLGVKSSRKLAVCIPDVVKVTDEWVSKPLEVPTTQSSCLFAMIAEGANTGALGFFNKPAKWSEGMTHIEHRKYVFEYVSVAAKWSAKNFQLIDDHDEERIVVQLVKMKPNVYSLDVKWPFSPLQAFGIALSSIDHKIACE